jgi:hypothetical protein
MPDRRPVNWPGVAFLLACMASAVFTVWAVAHLLLWILT